MKLLLIDGNSIMNRAFYGIMGNKMLSTKDGKYTNAVYGFLAILFKNMEELNPNYIAVSFDLKAKTERHKLYEAYKANRHGMPEELAMQMPMIKEVLKAMNICIIEKEGYEGDDILGTLSGLGEKNGLEVIILSGDRDTFQLATDKVTIRIPRTKNGKTETDEYDRNKVIEEYGLEPKALIEVKGLQGDTSDNIPGVPGIGPKTAINLIKEYGTIENLYKVIENEEDSLKGKTRETIIQNKDLAYLSRTLGEINLNVPLEEDIEELKAQEWNKKKVLELFKEWNFKRFIERFNLEGEEELKEQKKDLSNLFKENKDISLEQVIEIIKKQKKIFFYFGLENDQNPENIIKEKISWISIYNYQTNEVYNVKSEETGFYEFLKEIFENEDIEKVGYEFGKIYILLKQIGITMTNLKHDIKIASYILDPSIGKYPIDELIEEYLSININEYLKQKGIKEEKEQISLFSTEESDNNLQFVKTEFYAYGVFELSKLFNKKLEEIEALKLFEEIDMPTSEVLADMQWNGMHINEKDLIEYGKSLKDGIEVLTSEIYEIAGCEFNINSTKQLRRGSI